MFGVLRCELSHIAIYLKVMGLLLTEFLHYRGEESPEVEARRSKIPHAASVHAAAAGSALWGPTGTGEPWTSFFSCSRMSLLF
jgi:hypothetical protein